MKPKAEPARACPTLGAILVALAASACGDSTATPSDAGVDATTSDAVADAGLDAAAVSPCWTDTIGGLSNYATALRLHPSGDVIVEGEFVGTIDLGSTKLTAGPAPDGGNTIATFVARLKKADGDAVWARTVGVVGKTRLRGPLTIDPNGDVVIAGGFSTKLDDLAGITPPDPAGAAFVARLDGLSGATLAARALDVSSEPQRIVRGSDGTYVIAGLYNAYARLGPTPLPVTNSTDVWVTRLSLAESSVRWAVRVGDGGADSVGDLVMTDSDVPLLAGRVRSSGSIDDRLYVARLAFDTGAEVWKHDYPGPKAIVSTVAIALGDELDVLGYMAAAASIGGDPIPVDKSTESIWLGRWALADGAYRSSARIAKLSTNDARPVAGGPLPDGNVWYLSQNGLHMVTPSTGALVLEAQPGAQTGGQYDPPTRRWYSISQGSIRCSELK